MVQFGRTQFSVQTILLAARSLGMKARCVRQKPTRLERTPLPAIGIDRSGRFFMLAKIDQAGTDVSREWRILIQQAGQPPQVMSRQDFLSFWSGQVILVTSKASYSGESSRFDFTWFIPAVVKYRTLRGGIYAHLHRLQAGQADGQAQQEAS